MIAAIDTGIGRLAHALGAPFRWMTRRDRRRTAIHMLGQARRCYGGRSSLTLWDGRVRGGVGVLSMDRGSIQLYVEDAGYRVQWYGSDEHPIRFSEAEAADDVTLEAMLRKWTAAWYLEQRRPTAGPHHMEF